MDLFKECSYTPVLFFLITIQVRKKSLPITKIRRTDLNLNLTDICKSVLLCAAFASKHQKSFDGGKSTRAVMGP